MPTTLNDIYQLRPPYPGEDDYFKQNPHVAGMAAEDWKVTLNPYSKLSDREKQSVYLNEAARLYMRKNGTPKVSLTRGQQSNLAGTTYADADDEHRRATIMARLLSGDPSGGVATMEQGEALKPMLFLKDLIGRR